MNFLNDMTPTPFLATYPEARQAYDDRFEQIRFEWEQFTGSVA